MKTPNKIEIPDVAKGDHIVCIRGIWHINYYLDGVQFRRSTRIRDRKHALVLRDQFYEDLQREGAAVRQRKTAKEKALRKPDIYIYQRKPWIVQINGKVVGEADSKKEARQIRDKYLGL